MPMAEAWYVQGIKRDFSQAAKLVSGPFDDVGAVFDEIKRIEGFYPGIKLRPRKRRAKSLPERKPRTAAPVADDGYKLTRRAERERLADDIASRARALGATVEIENWDGEPDVDIITPSLRGQVWCCDIKGLPVPHVDWYGAKFPLRLVRGAWSSINECHYHKATSTPDTFAELFDMLEEGICAAIDGTAFDFDPGHAAAQRD